MFPAHARALATHRAASAFYRSEGGLAELVAKTNVSILLSNLLLKYSSTLDCNEYYLENNILYINVVITGKRLY